MAVSLSKGGNVSLSKNVPNLRRILVGLGWKARSTDGADFDLDASAFLLGQRTARSEATTISFSTTNWSRPAVRWSTPGITGPERGMATMKR